MGKFNKLLTCSLKWTPKVCRLDLKCTVKSFRVAFMNGIFLQILAIVVRP
ncbi:hypothetical protein CCACVL1_12715 [Corchorus capsularis]|uniref:Uncharacterized protein n=1 Tax=Corchorus capsularis TaxID=210143 RepID=A0A1R3IE51_COCAP|nr:hypothetical protein CCACVL1_12715 [Corchorus capsularis]